MSNVIDDTMEVSAARPSDASSLWELALRSKAHWGYSPEFMKACREELRVREEWIGAGNVFVARTGERLLGMFSFLDLPGGETELYHFFVRPEFIGLGIGAWLFDHAASIARERGYRRIQIQSDPNAEGFYLRMGARRTGRQESLSVEGRLLPLLVFDLDKPARPSIQGSATGCDNSA